MVVAVNLTSSIIRGMMHEVATVGEETTAYSIGYSIGRLLNLKRMIELVDFDTHQSSPIFSKDEMIDVIDETVNRLRKVTYPYKV